MELGDVIRTAVTSRFYTDQPVTDEELRTAFDYARFAPQGGNRQPVRFIVVRDQATKDQLAEWYRVPWKGYLEQAREGVIGVGVEAEKAAKTLDNADHFADHLQDIPVIVIACAHLEGVHPTDTELDRLSVVGGGSIYPAVQNFLLGCREAGLGAALTTLLVMFEPQVKELLNIPDGVVTAAHIPVGHRPKDFPTRLDRIGLGEVVYDGTWGQSLYA
ncbi:MAG: nitroreductase family protein [Actinomycetota bacterium]